MAEDVKPQAAERVRFGEKSVHPPHEAAVKALRRWQAKAPSGVAERTQSSGPPEEEKNLPQGSSGVRSTGEKVKPAAGHLDTTPLAKRFGELHQ